MTRRLFAYGTLQVPEVIGALLARVPPARPGVLADHACGRLRGCPFPGVVARPGASTRGLLYEDLNEAELRVVDGFEGGLYERVVAGIAAPGGARLSAQLYRLAERHHPALLAEAWDRERFVAEHLTEWVAACAALRSSLG